MNVKLIHNGHGYPFIETLMRGHRYIIHVCECYSPQGCSASSLVWLLQERRRSHRRIICPYPMLDDCRISWAKNSPTWRLHITLSLAWPSSAQRFLIIKLENPFFKINHFFTVKVIREKHLLSPPFVKFCLSCGNLMRFLIVGCVPVPKIPARSNKCWLSLLCCWNQSGHFRMWGMERFSFLCHAIHD